MNAVAIGPMLFAPDRFSAIIAGAVFVFVMWLVTRYVDMRLRGWSTWAIGAFIVGARLGHVLENFDSFSLDPVRIFAVWQGGFSWPVGLAATIVSAVFYLRNPKLILLAGVPMAVAGVVAAVTLQQFGTTPALGLPGSSFEMADGRILNAESLHGKPVVINLWATWCPPCRRELPMMADIASSEAAATFLFVNQGETSSQIQSYLDQASVVLKNVVLDPQGQFLDHYQVPGLPTTLFVDADGVLSSITVGEISKENLVAGIEALGQVENP